MYSISMSGLFDEDVITENLLCALTKEDIELITALHSDEKINFSSLPPNARRLFELSVNAFDSIVHAWMSELPITAEIIRYGQNVLEANERNAAEKAATDRGNPDMRIVAEAAYKVRHEIHRLMGLLRFSPNQDGVYIARCEPDHCVLPALGPYFRDRFGTTPWAIIDEKRRLCLHCTARAGFIPQLFSTDKNHQYAENLPDGAWGNLWRQYHKTINNESRNNPGLQKQFMPKRYWQYLNELEK